jgi:hypothetical protein
MTKRHFNAKLSVEEELVVLEKYDSGRSLESVGLDYGLSLTSIRNILLAYGKKPRSAGSKKKFFSDENIKKICDLYKNGISQEKIAKKINVSQCLVSRILRSSGLNKGVRSGADHPHWKGGILDFDGYNAELVSKSDPMYCMANSMGYVMQHRLVMARHLGRPLEKNETVHHINGIRKDNRIENLQLRHGKHGVNQCYECVNCGSRNIKAVLL